MSVVFFSFFSDISEGLVVLEIVGRSDMLFNCILW